MFFIDTFTPPPPPLVFDVDAGAGVELVPPPPPPPPPQPAATRATASTGIASHFFMRGPPRPCDRGRLRREVAYSAASSHSSSAFCECRRFSACSQTAERSPYSTASVISSPGWAGRQ